MIEIGPNLSSALTAVAACLGSAVIVWALFRQ